MTYRNFNLSALPFAVGIALFGATLLSNALAGGPCNVDEDCSDGNPCTDDVCDMGFCEYHFNNVLCTDGCACTRDDVCDGGECSGTLNPGCNKCLNDWECEDGDPCTDNTCFFGTCSLGGFCVITPACDDGNPCTDDTCSPEGQCFYAANYDPVSICCNSSNGLLSIIECDQTHCYDPVCFPMSCTCCDRPDGDPCAEPMTVPTASNWGMALLSLLLAVGITLKCKKHTEGGPRQRASRYRSTGTGYR